MTRQEKHGWLIVASLFVTMLAIVGSGYDTTPVFVPALLKEFGWSLHLPQRHRQAPVSRGSYQRCGRFFARGEGRAEDDFMALHASAKVQTEREQEMPE